MARIQPCVFRDFPDFDSLIRTEADQPSVHFGFWTEKFCVCCHFPCEPRVKYRVKCRVGRSETTGEAQFERHRFLTGFWVPKMVPKILQANLIFLCRVCDTGKPDGACREAESFQKSSPRRQQSGSNKTTRRVERMLFQWKMRTAPQRDTEQNGAKHFTVARRAIVTCFRRVMIVFAGICKGKTQKS